MFLGLRTTIYRVPDIVAAKAWYASALGVEPYFDEPFYVGFNIGGYEFGLQPIETENFLQEAATPLTYWGVENADEALIRLRAAGATIKEPIMDVGGGIRVASVTTPPGNIVGIIENPHFALP